MRAPVRGVRGNVLYGYGDERAAYYRVPTVSYDLFSREAQDNELAAWASFAFAIGMDFSIDRVSRGYPAGEYADDTAPMADARHAPADRWHTYLGEQQDSLYTYDPRDVETYVRVRFRAKSKPRPESDDETQTKTRRVRAVAQRRRRHPDLVVGEVEAKALQRLAHEFPGARRATASEIVWLARRAGIRGLGEPVVHKRYNPQPLEIDGKIWQPGHSHFSRFYDYELRPEARGVRIESEYGTSWQAVLALGELPDEWESRGRELLFRPLEAYGAAVDAVCHVKWISNDQMRKDVLGRVQDADVSFREQAHQQLSWVPDENRARARDTERYYSSQPYPPGLLATVFLVVAATSREDREHAVGALRDAFGGQRLERLPLRKQVDGWLDTLPDARGPRVMDYADFWRLATFGSLMPHASHGAGPARGVFFGTTHGRVVRRDPREPARRRRSPAALYSGGLGSGKTLAVEKIVVEDVLAGSQAVVSDPKPDWRAHELRELAGMVHLLELAANATNRGLLDPLVITPAAWREDRAVSFLTDLMLGAPFTWKARVREAVQMVLRTRQPGCLQVLEALSRGDSEAKQVARHLRPYTKGGLASLGFSEGDPARVRIDHPLTIIRPAGLVLPHVDVPRERYDEIQVLSVAIQKLIAVFAMRAVDSDRSRHKRIALDEAHTMVVNPDGRRVIHDLNTMGRAKNASLDLITQRMTPDFLELQELMAQRYIFGQESEAQARIGAAVLGLDPDDPDLVHRILGMREGRCLYRDLDGRIAATQVDLLPRWVDALDTTPPEADERAAA